MTLRVGIVGVGRIGRLHAGIVRSRVPGASLSCVVDVDQDAATAVGRELGVEVAANLDELLAADVDAVAVCSATDTHVEVIRRSAEAGKAVFTEKPISLDLASVDVVVDVIDRTGVPFMVGFQRRFDDGHRAVREAVHRGDLGAVHLVRLTSRDPAPPPLDYIRVSGGIFLDSAIHDYDLARFIVGTPVVQVYAQGAVRIDPAIGEAGDVDTAVTVLTHACGAITTVDNSRSTTYGYDQRVEAFGRNGMVVSGNHRVDAVETYGRDGVRTATLQHFFLERYSQAYVNEWVEFVKYVATGGESPVSARDGRSPVVIGEAAWTSVRDGRPVAVDGG